MSSTAALVQVQHLHKSYAAPVLVDVSLDLHAGEVHALVGANGAGKSTLARILAGLVTPESGSLRLGGQTFSPRSRREAERRGVQIVFQELNLIPTLTVAENLFFGSWPHRAGWIRHRPLRQQAERALSAIGLDVLDPETPAGELGVGEQQLVEIAASLTRPCRMLILDEPTAALTDPQIGRLFERIAELKRRQVAILYISHRLDEIPQIAERVTILRDGKVVETQPATAISTDYLVEQMVGLDSSAEIRRQAASHPQAQMECLPRRDALSLRVNRLCRGPRVREISFEIHQGEIFGLFGLVGSGRTETLRAIFGADRSEKGEVTVLQNGQACCVCTPRDAVRAGMGMVPEDRKQHGLLLPKALSANITLANVPTRALFFLDLKSEREASDAWAQHLEIRCRDVEQSVVELSGGNQQKSVIARWLFQECQVLLFDEPTRGVDVGAKNGIYKLLRSLSEARRTIIVASSELLELDILCHRIGVLSAGRLVRIFERGEWSEEKLLAAAFTYHLKGAPTHG